VTSFSSWHLYVIGNPRIVEQASSQASAEDGQGSVVVSERVLEEAMEVVRPSTTYV
jgi:hypothetical protein